MPGDLWDERAAAVYDETSADMYAPEVLGPTVDLLAELAGGPGSRALELAVGTGRVAIPLAERGVEVHGIDLSQPMLDVLDGKGSPVTWTCGDMATTRVDGTFSLVYVVFNSISNLLTQAEQVATVRNAAAHLEPGGRFLVELWVPDLQRLPPGTTFQVFDRTGDHLGFDEYDVARQRVTSHHWFDLADGSTYKVRSRHRWIWPSELDLMAQLAGMALVDRWADWSRAPFTSESRSHVSVWQAPT